MADTSTYHPPGHEDNDVPPGHEDNDVDRRRTAAGQDRDLESGHTHVGEEEEEPEEEEASQVWSCT